MKDHIILSEDYFDKFIENESILKEKHKGAYFSKPQLRIKNDGNAIAIAPWGNPGWSSKVIFAYCHYFTVTFLNKNQTLETLIFDHAVLMSYLEGKFEVEEITTPTPHILIKMPDLMANSEMEQNFLDDLAKLPNIK